MMRRTVGAPREIVIVIALFIALGIVYSVTTPLFEAPDEPWHFAFVQHVATGRGLPAQAEPLTHLARQEGSQPPLYYLLAAALTFWIDTSDFPDIVWENPHYGYNVPGIVNDNKNLFIHTARESFPYRGAVLALHLARGLSVLMGALAVLFTYLLALEIFSCSKLLAASASAIIAFVPQFLFISGAVSNDSTIAAMSAGALWLMARLLRAQPSWRAIVVLGIAVGFAALAKVSGLGLSVLVTFALGWKAWRDRNEPNALRRTLLQFLLFTFVFSLVAGWWYIRNLVLYGELTGTARMSEIFHVRAAPMPLDQLLVQLREVWETFWIGFGWGNIRAQPIVYTVIEIFVVLSGIGWVIKIRRSRCAMRHSQFALLVGWLGMMFAALVFWMQTTQAPHGRLLFPALPALAVLLVGGLGQFQRSALSGQRSRFTLLGLVLPFAVLLFACSALAPFLILQPAYTYPPTLSESDSSNIPNRVDISYDDKIELLGYAVSARRVAPGDAIELTLYWRALAPMDEDYTIGLRVLDAQQGVIGARNSYPGHGMLPTRVWLAGQTLRDVYWLPINADAPRGAAQLQVVVFERVRRHDLVARDPRGEVITPFIGQLEIAAK